MGEQKKKEIIKVKIKTEKQQLSAVLSELLFCQNFSRKIFSAVWALLIRKQKCVRIISVLSTALLIHITVSALSLAT